MFVVIAPSSIHLYVDGGSPVSLSSTTLSILNQLHFYIGRLKFGDDPEPFVGSMLGPSVSFSEPILENIPGYLFCTINCGESLFTRKVDKRISVSASSNKLLLTTWSFESLTSSLSGLSYNNTASEPTTHNREIAVFISDGRYETNITLTIQILLVNEHNASMDLKTQSSGNVFFYVEPSLGPYPTRTTPNAVFDDEDTSQTEYALRVDVIPPPRRLCDRVDYAVKVKLEVCGSSPPLVMNLLPDHQWGLGTVIGVQSSYDYFIGYQYYGSGVFISDMTIYQNSMMDALHFTFITWFKQDGMGTIVHIVDKIKPFLFWLRVNGTMLESVHSFHIDQRESIQWNWKQSDEWVHLALIVSGSEMKLCINAYDCQIKTLQNVTMQHLLVNNLDTHVGAVPDNGAYTDNFDGTLSGVALIPNYTMPISTLNCLISCAEYIVISNFESSTGNELTYLTRTTKTGILSLNGSLFVQKAVRQDQVQDFLQNVAYINTHPYPLPGERQVMYSVKDGISETEILGSSSLVVLYHGYRNLQLLRILRVTITASQLMYGVRPFESTGITTDARRDKMDSLMIELTSRPQHSSSCLLNNPIQSDCPYLIYLNPTLLHNSTLHIIKKSNKIVVCGLSTVNHYQTLLREVTVQWANPDALVTSRSEFKLRVYISDMNGVSSTTKTLTVQVQGIVRPQEDISMEDEANTTTDTTEMTTTMKLSTEFRGDSCKTCTLSIICTLISIALTFTAAFNQI